MIIFFANTKQFYLSQWAMILSLDPKYANLCAQIYMSIKILFINENTADTCFLVEE